MKRDIFCPFCNKDFEVEFNWDLNNCPGCNREYHFDMVPVEDEDFFDYYIDVIWY